MRAPTPLAPTPGARRRRRLPAALWLWLWCLPLAAAEAPLQIEVDGGDAALETQLRLQSGLAGLGCDAPRWRVRRLFQAAPGRLGAVLRIFGYYRPEIDRSLEFGRDCWSARFRIRRGEPVRIDELELAVVGEGREDPAFARLLARLPLHKGAILRQTDYEAAKERLASLAAERGYLEARFIRHEIRVVAENGEAAVHLVLDTGPRYRLDEVQLPEIPLSAALVARYTGLAPGAPYSADALAQAYVHLRDSGYFSHVDLTPRLTPNPAHRIPVSAELRLKKRHAWRAGAGLDTDTGPRLSLGYQNRYLNRRGHRLEANLRLSPVLSTLDTSYQMPGADPLRQRLALRGGVKYEDTSSTRATTYTLGYLRTQRRRSATTAWSLDLTREESRVGGTEQSSLLLLPGVSWDWLRVAPGERPRSGERLRATVRGTHTALLSDASFLRLYASGKAMRPLGRGRLLVRAEIGATLTGSVDDLPASERFFAGGDNSVRGYAYKGLGPRDANGDPTGGRYLFTGSLEYQLPVRPDWSLALFADTGNAFEARFGTLKSALGVGVVWHTPFTPVRLYLALPRDRRDGGLRIHFGMGPEI